MSFPSQTVLIHGAPEGTDRFHLQQHNAPGALWLGLSVTDGPDDADIRVTFGLVSDPQQAGRSIATLRREGPGAVSTVVPAGGELDYVNTFEVRWTITTAQPESRAPDAELELGAPAGHGPVVAAVSVVAL